MNTDMIKEIAMEMQEAANRRPKAVELGRLLLRKNLTAREQARKQRLALGVELGADASWRKEVVRLRRITGKV